VHTLEEEQDSVSFLRIEGDDASIKLLGHRNNTGIMDIWWSDDLMAHSIPIV